MKTNKPTQLKSATKHIDVLRPPGLKKLAKPCAHAGLMQAIKQQVKPATA